MSDLETYNWYTVEDWNGKLFIIIIGDSPIDSASIYHIIIWAINDKIDKQQIWKKILNI